MDSVMELLYNAILGEWCMKPQAPDSEFVKIAHIKNENLKMLMNSLSPSQKEWFDLFSEADVEIQNMISLKDFCNAFHLGAQIMAELIRGKEELLK